MLILQTVSRYVLRGCGKQSKGSVIHFISYFVIGLPIGITLMFKTELRLFGKNNIRKINSVKQCFICASYN